MCLKKDFCWERNKKFFANAQKDLNEQVPPEKNTNVVY